jgi:outer membrane protein OmpA-like peptidoglycan-associated protein
MGHSACLRLPGLLSLLLVLAACAPALDVKPIDLNAEPAAQIKTLKTALDAARQDEVPLFSPTWFTRANASAAEAASARAQGGEIGAMLKAVAQGDAELAQARHFAAIAHKELSATYQARKDALSAGAGDLYVDDFVAAERGFRGLTEDIESDNLSGARKHSKNVLQAYRDLELRAIKQHTLGEVRRLNQLAVRAGARRYTPRTLKEAEDSLAATDSFITTNPKATREIQTKAGDSLRRAQHLQIVLQQVQEWERLGIEDRVRYVDDALNKIDTIVATDDEDKPVLTLAKRFETLEQRARVLMDNQAFLNTELSRVQEERRQEMMDALKRETEYQTRIAKTSAGEQQAAAQLKAERETAARFERVRQMFSDAEADVYRQGGDMLIRLKGLNFEIGDAYLLPEHYPLLTKVMQAARVINASKMVVEGHTDTTGTAAVNQALSQERAAAVKAYIVNNGGMGANLITVIGFGPDKPIAANTSAEGRRLNRRTDILLSTR